MKKLQLAALLCFVVALFVLSCKKNTAPPPNGGGTSTGNDSLGTKTASGDSVVYSLNFMLSIPVNYELIISEP